MFRQLAILFFSFIFLYLTSCRLPSIAAQHALVVGINQYQGESRKPLHGAINDAKLIEKTLRKIGVNLPVERVLLDEQATRVNIIHAWRQMVAQAKPGDTLIFTFAGHGSRIKEQPPQDEQQTDNQDETLVLYDDLNCLLDDELHDLFLQTNQYHILFLVDACHSGGLTQKIISGKVRANPSSCSVNAFKPPLLTSRIGDKMVTEDKLPHLTVISAVNSETDEVGEQNFEGKTYGALSYYFAQALLGKADSDDNHELTRGELYDYLKEQVQKKTSFSQEPKIFPAGYSEKVVVKTVIDKEIFLAALATQFDKHSPQVQVELTPKMDIYPKGERLFFTIKPVDETAGLNHLTLFNLAGNGKLIFLYPLEEREHPSRISQFPYSLPPLSIQPPYGRDNLVVILCQQLPERLHKLLTENKPYLPEPQAFIDALQTQRCQIGQHAFFSTERR